MRSYHKISPVLSNTTWLLLLSLTILSLSCEKVGVINREKFTGKYEIEFVHISEIRTFFDSVGNIIFQGVDTTTVSNELLSINIGGGKDTLLVSELVNSFFSTRTIKGVLENDMIRLTHEFSVPMLYNRYVRGDIWLEGDSIFLNYKYDQSDTWSDFALPERGEIEGRGIAIE